MALEIKPMIIGERTGIEIAAHREPHPFGEAGRLIAWPESQEPGNRRNQPH